MTPRPIPQPIPRPPLERLHPGPSGPAWFGAAANSIAFFPIMMGAFALFYAAWWITSGQKQILCDPELPEPPKFIDFTTS